MNFISSTKNIEIRYMVGFSQDVSQVITFTSAWILGLGDNNLTKGLEMKLKARTSLTRLRRRMKNCFQPSKARRWGSRWFWSPRFEASRREASVRDDAKAGSSKCNPLCPLAPWHSTFVVPLLSLLWSWSPPFLGGSPEPAPHCCPGSPPSRPPGTPSACCG